MAKKVVAIVKLQCPAGAANPSPPVGPALGQHGVNIMEFCKSFNARTQDKQGLIIPAVITVYSDRSFTFELRTPPAAVLLKRAAKIAKGSGAPNRDKVAKVTRKQLIEIRAVDGHRRRGLVMAKNKRFNAASVGLEEGKSYSLTDAVALLKVGPSPKFDESIDLAMNLGVDPRHADQMVRGALVLPHGIGKDTRVLVFAKGGKEAEAKAAGADFVGGEDLAKKITDEGWLDFERVIATPDMMSVVGRLGKVLGPRGLMPNPKLGTVTMDVGKKSFGAAKIVDNAAALIDAIVRAKPASSKGIYLKKITISTTMGPGIRIDPATLPAAAA